MNDVEIAKANLAGHSICLCKDGNCLYSDQRGIAPMMGFIAEGVNLAGYAVADLLVGKAAAMLFVKCGIKEAYAKTLSRSGRKVLEQYGIPYAYETLTEQIINRAGTDICPMEKALLGVENAEEAYLALKETLRKMQ